MTYLAEYTPVIHACNLETGENATHPGLTGRRMGPHPSACDELLSKAPETAKKAPCLTAEYDGDTPGVICKERGNHCESDTPVVRKEVRSHSDCSEVKEYNPTHFEKQVPLSPAWIEKPTPVKKEAPPTPPVHTTPDE